MSRRTRSALGAIMATVGLLSAPLPAWAADTLAKVADRGKLSVCTNVNNPPSLFLEPSGKARGLHMDLLDDLRERLSKRVGKPVEIELVPTLPANRIQFLQQGKCDMIFTSLTVTPEREKLVQFIQPFFYAAGAGLQTKKGVTIARWEDLKGKSVCSNQGSSWNLPLEQTYGATIVAFQTQQDVDQSLRDGRCVALVSDDSYLQSRFVTDKDGNWKDYMVQDLKPFSESPQGLAIRFGDPEFQDFLSGVVKDWHASGKVIEEAKTWGLRPPLFSAEMRDRYKAR